MKTIQEVKDFLVAQFPHEKIYLFGSRARGEESMHSDIDIAIDGDALGSRLSHARFVLEESLVPYKIDLVDLSKASYLKGIIQKEGVVWH